jgi:hypothetical protein
VFTKQQPLEPGRYDAVIKTIEIADTAYGKGLKWIFELALDPPVKRTGYSSMATGRGSKCKKWVEALLGRSVDDNERIDLDRFVEFRCRVLIDHRTNDEGEVYDVVESVFAAVAPATRTAAPPAPSAVKPWKAARPARPREEEEVPLEDDPPC